MAVRVVSDTGPLHYLVLIGMIALLPTLFGRVSIPEAVAEELGHPETPAAVRDWIAEPPPWLSVVPGPFADDPSLDRLDLGERQAVLLARETKADLLLMDDRAGRRLARAAGFGVVGTLGLIDLADRRALLDLESCVDRLRRTNFRCRPTLYDQLLAGSRGRKGQARDT